MKRIRLLELHLRNFRKITGSLILGGRSAVITGQNETGKTTYCDAHFYLLTGKNYAGQSKFDIKTRDENWQEVNGLEHEVREVWDCDGDRTELKKIYHEVWTKKRGSAQAIFSGHTVDYYVDGEGLSEGKFNDKVAEMLGDPVEFSLVTNPSYLTDMTTDKDWVKARALLLKYFSTITEETVLNSSPDMLELKALVGKKTVDSFKGMVTDKQNQINADLVKIPTRIDEQTRNMSDITGIDVVAERDAIVRLGNEINEISLKISGINNGGTIAGLSAQLAGINADIAKMETAHYSETTKAVNLLTQQAHEASEKLNSDKRLIATYGGDIKAKTDQITRIDGDLAVLRTKWATVDAEEFQDSTREVCPACAQPLPAERVQDAREKALAAFNQDKAERLEKINHSGKELKESKIRIQESVATTKGELESIEKAIPEREELYKTLTAKQDAARIRATEYGAFKGYADLVSGKEALEKAIKAEREGAAPDIEKLTAKKSFLEAEKLIAEAKIRNFDNNAKAKIRIAELKDEEKRLAASFEELERQKFLCETFTRIQAEMLSEEVNQHFKLVRWQLFETQVNGGVIPRCLVTVKAGTYGRGLNDGNKINAGLDICSAFSKAAELDAPIFVDRAETVTSDFESDMQIIKFIAKRGVTELRVELEKEKVAA